MLRRVFSSILLALLLGTTHCVGEDCSAEPYFRAFDLAAFCSTSTACTPGGTRAADDSEGDNPEWFQAFEPSPAVIDLTALDDVLRTKPFLGFAPYTSTGVVPNPTQVHFDDDTPCVPLTHAPADGQDYACEVPHGAKTLTIAGGQTSGSFTMYLFGRELASQTICAG